MTTFASLPGDLLTAIASYVDTPHFVVAVAADGDARAAVRRGVDEAERALRGMSVRGAEAFLLHAYRVPAAALSDRHAAGLVLVEKAAGYEFDSDIIPTLLAYGSFSDQAGHFGSSWPGGGERPPIRYEDSRGDLGGPLDTQLLIYSYIKR